MNIITVAEISVGETEKARATMGMSVADFALTYGFPLSQYEQLARGADTEALPASMQEPAQKALDAEMDFKVAANSQSGNTLTPDAPAIKKSRSAKKKSGAVKVSTVKQSEHSNSDKGPSARNLKKLVASNDDKRDATKPDDSLERHIDANSEGVTVEGEVTKDKHAKRRAGKNQKIEAHSINANSAEPVNSETECANNVEVSEEQAKATTHKGADIAGDDTSMTAGIGKAGGKTKRALYDYDGKGPLPLPPTMGDEYSGMSREELLDALESLPERDAKKKIIKPIAMKALIKANKCEKIVTALLSLDGRIDKTLAAIVIGLIKSAIGGTEKQAKVVYDTAMIAHAKNRANDDDLAAEQKKVEEEEAAAERLRIEQEIMELEAEVGKHARDPKLLSHIIDLAHSEGVVLEDDSIVIATLVATSRLTGSKRAMALLRLGAPSAGKNFVVDIVLRMLPPESVVTISGASAKAIYYLGGEDEYSLQHKVLYIPEAAAIASRGGDEHELSLALRNLLGAEGTLSYMTADVGGENGELREARVITKYGPIAVILTSARENVEAELRTRLIEDYADERVGTTHLVQERLAQQAAGKEPERKGPLTLEIVRKLNQLLNLKGPQAVVIPFAEAIVSLWQKEASVMVRSRRDTAQIFAAIEASAILHQYQRQKNDSGKIIATLDDYAAAFKACERGMKSINSPEIKPEVIQFVEVLEILFDEQLKAAKITRDTWIAENNAKPEGQRVSEAFGPKTPTMIKATYEQLRRAMGVGSKDTVTTRASDALAAEVVERVEAEAGGVGRKPSHWRIKVPSAQLREGAEAVKVLPTRDDLAKEIENPSAKTKAA